MTITLDTTSLYSGKGFDVRSMVNQVLDSKRGQENQWKSQQAHLQQQSDALNEIQSQIAAFYTDSLNLTDFTGVLGSKSAVSSDTGVVLATANSGATTGSHVLRVENLASTGSAYSTAIADDDDLEPGSFTISVGTTSKNVDIGTGNKSLNDIAEEINKLKMGVTASVQQDEAGSRVRILSDVSGQTGAVQITGGTSQLSFTVNQGRDAVVDIDGIPYQSSSNSVMGAITGVSLNLATAAPDTDVLLSVSPDISRVAESIANWVNAYNALVNSTNAQFSYDPSSGSSGALSGDSSLRLLQDSLLRLATFSNSDDAAYHSLAAIGIKMDDDGTLSIDSGTLNDVLTNHFADLTGFLQGTGSFGDTLGSAVRMLNSPTIGPISLDLQTTRQTSQYLKSEIQDFEDRLASEEKTLLARYSQINASLQALPSLQSQLSMVLDSLSPLNSNK